MCVLSHIQLLTTLWTVACQAHQSMEFSRQEYWNGLPFPSSEDLSNAGIQPAAPSSLALQEDSLPLEPLGLQPEEYVNLQSVDQSFCYKDWKELS